MKQKKAKGLQQQLFQTDTFSRIYLVIMLCIFPLFLAKGRYVNLTLTKATFFFIATGLYILSIPLLRLTQFDGKKKTNTRFKPSFALEEWALIAFLFFSLLAAILSPYPKDTFWGRSERYDGLVSCLMYGGLFFMISRYYKPRSKDFMWFAISAMIISIIGILQYFDMDPFQLFPYDLVEGSTPRNIIFRTTLGNIDIVSSYTSLTVMMFGMLYVKGKGSLRFLFLAAGMLSVVLMMLAGAEAGMVGVMAAFVLAMPFLLTDYVSISRFAFLGCAYCLSVVAFTQADKLSLGQSIQGIFSSRFLLIGLALFLAGIVISLVGRHIHVKLSVKTIRLVTAGLMVIVVLLGFAFVEVIGQDPGTGSVYQAREILHGRMEDEFGTYRGYVWNRSLELLRDKTPAWQLLFGSGPDTFVNRFRSFHSETIEMLGERYDKAHNEYLQILFCQGILGLLAYLVFLGALCVKAVRRAFEDPLLLAALIGSIAYIVQAFFSISNPIVTPLFFIMLGLVASRYKATDDGILL